MRENHFCRTCAWKLPYCVRQDRVYCSSACRMWAVRHPGRKRPLRGHSILPDAPKRCRPTTRAAALNALEASRRYAVRLEAAAREQEARERELHAELANLRAGVLSDKRELADTKERLARTEQQKNEKAKKNYQRKRQAERLIDRVKRAEREVTRKEKALDQARVDLATLRCQHEQQAAEQASQLSDARAEVKHLSQTRDELAGRVKKLTETTEQLEQRATEVEHKLKQRDEDLDHERKQMNEAKRDREESRAHAELLQRRLEAEQAKRAAAEQKLEQAELSAGSPSATGAQSLRSASSMSSLRLERYRELGAVLGYNPASDRLFALMHEEVLVAAAYADWQAAHMERITSRRRDISQSMDEQCFAAALAVRWHLVDRPHLRLGATPQWRLVGCLLDERSERYLLTLTNERIAEMRGRMQNAC